MSLFRAKIKAFGVHLLVSAVIFLPFLYLIVYHWYPMPYFLTDGGWQGVRIMLAIDMVIGPALTLLVYDPRKSRAAMGFDYTFISLVQAAALTWGYINVESQRPVVITVYQGGYKAVIWERLALQDADRDTLSALSPHEPPMAYIEPPIPGVNRKQVSELGLRKGLAPSEMVMLMRPYSEHLDAIKADRLDLDRVAESIPEITDELNDLRKRAETGSTATTYHLVDGRFERALIAVDAKGELVDWLVLPRPKGPRAQTPPSEGDSPKGSD